MIGISVFDLDRTLTIRPTYSAFLLFAALRLAPWRLALAPMLLPVAAAYGCKAVSRRRMKETMHAVAIGRSIARHRVEPVAHAFADRLALGGIYPQAPDLIAAEQAAGRRTVIATAAPLLYVAPLARRLGIGDVIATEGQWDNDRLGARLRDDNCYGPAKRQRIAAWLADQGIDREQAHIRFYSDHASDRPTFDWVDEPVAVNPSSRLRDLAAQRGWRVVDWRGGAAG